MIGRANALIQHAARLRRSALTALTERNPVEMCQPVETSHFRLALSNRLTHSHTRKAVRSGDDST